MKSVEVSKQENRSVSVKQRIKSEEVVQHIENNMLNLVDGSEKLANANSDEPKTPAC